MLRGCRPSDASRICEIYNHIVRETVVTFEEEPVSGSEMAGRIQKVTVELPWLVWEEAGSIWGYAYATRWKARSAYRFASESTVYVAPGLTRRGTGTRLYEALLVQLRRRNVHCVAGGIFGWKLGRWVDVGYWERLLHDG